MRQFWELLKGWSEAAVTSFRNLPLWLKYAIVVLLFAGMASSIIWRWGLRRQIDKGFVGVEPRGAPLVNNLWFLPDGTLVGTVGQTRDELVVSIWHPGDQILRAERRTFHIYEFQNAIRRFAEAEGELGERYTLSAQPAVMRDGSRMILYEWGILASFPYNWTGNRNEVELVDLGTDPSQSPLAITVTDNNRIALAYPDGRVEFRSALGIHQVVGGRQTKLSKPSIMKPLDNLLAVVSTQNAAVVMLDVNSVQDTPFHGYPPTPIEQFTLAISRNGRLAIGTGADEVRLTGADGSGDANIPVRAYGNVKILSFFDEDRVIAGGEFQDVYLLAPGTIPERVAVAPSGITALAVNSNRLAYAGADGLVLLWHTNSRHINKVGLTTIIVFGVILLGLVGLYRYDYKHRREAISIPEVALPPVPAGLPIPQPPQELIEAFWANECVLYGGAGISAQAGFVTWGAFVEQLTRWAIDSNFIDQSFGGSLLAAIDQGQYGSVADNLVGIMRSHDDEFNAYLRETFVRKAPMPPAISLLGNFPFSAALTTNLDLLLEQSFSSNPTVQGPPMVFTPKDPEPLLELLQKREFFLLKLSGQLGRPETIMIGSAQYDDAVQGNLLFSKFMETLLFSRTLFFVGVSLEGIEVFFKGVSLPHQNRRTHYALVAVTGEAWQAKAKPLQARYGVEILPYSPSAGYPELLSFLQNLDQRIKSEGQRPLDDVDTGTRLKRVQLSDIGPFDNLEIDFDPNWNILLGDNGVGKSSIIKAIAVAILGEDARATAGRIIKSGKTNSAITLVTGRNTYSTKLLRSNGEARIESIPGRPFEAEGWLAIGFPPLRAVSWARPKAPETETKGRPTPEDLLPVITGETDPRLDKLKQWIVNIDYWIKDAHSRKKDASKYERLLADFFDVVERLTKGVNIQFKEVKPQTNEVTIITDDGELPIEALSQGMTSLIGWVGILLQRLYEVYGADQDPKQRYALVLMDEIDAHLHPAWQQSLTRELSKIFPNVQFIATTHSPLIVGGMLPRQILRFARDENQKVVVYQVDEEMTLGRADQILTSDLFGLQSTASLNAEVEELMKEYHELLGQESRSEEQEVRFQRLRETLRTRMPLSGENPPEKKAMQLLQALLQGNGKDGKYEDVNHDLLDKAEQLLNEVGKKRK